MITNGTLAVVADFFVSFVVSTGILLLLASPTLYLAWRKGRRKKFRSFLIGAGGLGLTLAAVSASSARLLEQCEAENLRSCFDYGSVGMRLTFIVIFTIIAWVNAVILYDA